MAESTFDRPFPALTPEQRYHLDVFGYVVVPDTLTADEVGLLHEALQKLKRDLNLTSDPLNTRVRGAKFAVYEPHHTFIGSILEAHPAITAYVTHPRLVGMAEELIGGEARIVEVNAHINSRDPNASMDEEPAYGFHRGIDIPYGSHKQESLYHCSFVKTLTNLTNLAPDDGGTVVIAGSHKIEASTAEIVACAYKDRSLIHQVVAPSGSTLLFSETLIHATGRIRSERERVIIICGYATTMFQYWDGRQLSEGFKKHIPDKLKRLFHGYAHWTRGEKYRKLSDPADERRFTLGTWWDR